MLINRIKYLLIGICLFFVFTGMSAQTLPTIPIPQPVDPNRGLLPSFPYNNPQPDIYNPNELTDIRKRNNEMIERDIEEVQQRAQIEIQRRSAIRLLVDSGFPSLSDIYDTSCYTKAFDEIENMLKGTQPMNLGRAVFLVENAYYDDSISYQYYQKAIKTKIELCNAKIKEEKLDGQTNIVKNIMLFSILTDTLKIKTGGKTVTSFPLKYDLDDYQSQLNYDSRFVTKLMRTGIGQCQSMPLYYLDCLTDHLAPISRVGI